MKPEVFTLYFCHARGHFLRGTSGGVFVDGVTREVLDEALDGDGLTDSFESLSASLAPFPFTWGHKHPSAFRLSVIIEQPQKAPTI